MLQEKAAEWGWSYNKLLAEICGKPVIAWTVENFVMSSLIDKIILVVNPDEKVVFKKIIEPYTAVTDITLVKAEVQGRIQFIMAARSEKFC